MPVRRACVAGHFYPSERQACEAEIDACIEEDQVFSSPSLPVVAGIVPHAGWIYSGALAGLVYRAIRETKPHVATFLLFGADHYRRSDRIAVFSSGSWETPLGTVEVASDLARRLLAADVAFDDAPEAHSPEHSIEVQIPFLQRLFPSARVVPILVPPAFAASDAGRAAWSVLEEAEREGVVAIASSDLTHYGHQAYGFAPHGSGPAALDWVRRVNDRRLIEILVEGKAEEVVPEALQHRSACGPGAMAALVGYARAASRPRGTLLRYATSYDVRPDGPIPKQFVGYAAIVY